MIPQADVTTWREMAPWPTDAQVEQDLVISRALIKIFSEESLRKTLAFRGGTALNKLVLKSPTRYSEDIDLVQIDAGPIGGTIDILRKKLDPWLGEGGDPHLPYRRNARHKTTGSVSAERVPP